MSKKGKIKKSTAEEVFNSLDETASRSEKFIEEHKSIIIGLVVGVIAVIGGYMSYTSYYVAPLQKEATNELFNAKKYFEQDSLRIALEGDGQYLGFIDIANDYGVTETGNIANYYAGVSYLKLGEYENAIKYLKKFSSNDKMLSSIAIGAIGDAYAQSKEFENALDYYKKAASNKENDFTSPLYLLKGGKIALKLEKYDVALDLFENIKSDFPKSKEGKIIDKFIAMAKAHKK